MEVDMEEVSILAKEVYKWKSLFSDKKQSNPRLVRWDATKQATIDNLAFMSREDYEKHLKFANIEEANYPQQIHARFA